MIKEHIVETEFERDVLDGLCQEPKRLLSKYFYDDKGDKLFQEIMKMEEYYLTRSEFEIFTSQKDSILNAIERNEEKLQLIEFGAGDGLKTKVLLKYFIEKGLDFEYLPIDISSSVLSELEEALEKEIPELKVTTIEDTYFSALNKLDSNHKKLVLFLGSNIGNFNSDEVIDFLERANRYLNKGDYFLIGVDLKKHPLTILDAYNDKRGITKAFNLNLLARINRELEGDFDLSQFEHYPTYDPQSGEAKSFLISLKEQTVELKKLNQFIHFKYAEPIFMEVSKKYGVKELEDLAFKTNFQVIEHFYDCKHFFVNTLWKK